ncbi:hypothetical protein K2173_011633 [Erythroxylum novogranatense]|uniref:Zinc ion binding protein n=1 Tax=Erythroxylum novogranatense TaxID=1862640 RepID=A0AAV8U884_9ROSI|nr:hypothetical protein K2173_011633 [Erythroxylum novogranatense]
MTEVAKNMNLGDLNKVWEIRALKRKPGEEDAKKFLEKIAKQVQPIMRKRKWRVKILSEMCPKNPALLGLNVGHGLHVKLRLRRPNRDWDFYPFDQVLDTMLHELCHNVHGPHNANFYKLWDELRQECEDLISKGISGTEEGFDLPGRRLGGFSCQPPLSSLHRTTAAAAQKRAKLRSILPSGPKRLGGDSTIMEALSPIQAAAMAAERRLKDDIWCGSHSAEAYVDGENGFDISEESIDKNQLTGVSEPSNTRKRNHDNDNATTSFSSSQLALNIVKLSSDASTSEPVLDHDTNSKKRALNNDAACDPADPAVWECGTCTLLNPPLAPICGVCGTQKPKDFYAMNKTWCCKFCTLENFVNVAKCSACNQWRYSHGPPVSSPAPSLGT